MNINNLKSISFNDIKEFLTNYVKTLPDYDTKWKDFYESGAGTTLIELASGVASFLSYQAYMNRRDSLLDHSALPSTIRSIANTLGYPVNRKSAPILKLTFNIPNDISLSRDIPIGNWSGRPVSLVNDVYLKAGENTVTCVLGTWNEYSKELTEVIEFSNLIIERNIDNNYAEVYLDDIKLRLVREVADLDEKSVLFKSIENGVILILGNGHLGASYRTGNTIKLKYIEPEDNLPVGINILDKLKLNFEVKDLDAVTISSGSVSDSLNKLVNLAPGFHSSRGRIIYWTDLESVGASYQGVISAKGFPRPNTCCSADVYYLTWDERKFNDEEKYSFLQYLKSKSMMGIDYFIHESRPIYVDVSIKIVLDDFKHQDEINQLVLDKLNSMTMKLGHLFSISNVYQIESDKVKAIYIDYPMNDKLARPDQYFKIRDLDIKYITNSQRGELRFGTNEVSGYEEQ